MANRLHGHPSPYLEQHADNPVDWWAWGEDAFAEAKRRDVPIFLSIGYATCHWCHVMAHEVFEDDEAAAVLNNSFVCIKVDREERPDIDEAYMAICQAMTGRGGWPLTAILDHEKRAWFTGTYFPKHGRGHHLGIMELVPKLREAWIDKRQEVEQSGKHILQHMVQAREAGELPPDLLAQAASGLMQRHDPNLGGFGGAPKFPSAHNLNLLLAHHFHSGDPAALRAVTTTLDAMAAGGLHDHVGGGFHRYSTDSAWLLPHFEKMLYDQATMLSAYTQAWQVTKEPRYEQVATGIVEYVLRDLSHPQGGFFSAEDADSEGEEGTFYIWHWAELVSLVGETPARNLGARPDGNFHDESTGKPDPRNILHVPAGTDTSPFATTFTHLLEVRAKRVRPLRDEKILTDWNGLWIDALAQAAKVLAKPEWLAAAKRGANFVLANLNGTELRHRWRDGVVDDGAFLDDYASFGNALVSLFEATGEAKWLKAAKPLATQLQERFPHDGAFTTAPRDGFRLAPQTIAYDGAAPSGNSQTLRFLVRLGRWSDEKLVTAGVAVAEHFAADLAGQPSAYCAMIAALDGANNPTEIITAGDHFEAVSWQQFVPGAIRVQAGTTAINWVDAHKEPGGYICQNQACDAPARSLDAFKSRLAALAQAP